LLLAAVLSMACHGREGSMARRSGADDKKVTVTRTFSADQIRNIRVFEVGGSIRVDAAPVKEITLTANASGPLEIKPQAENQGLFETTVEGDTLRIGRKEDKRSFRFNFFFGKNDVEIDYVLQVPPTVSLDLRTVNGRIATRGGEGETEASTVNGSIDVEVAGLRGLSATTVNGRVRAKFTRSFQGAQFKSVNGGVEAILPKDASFRVDLAQVNGDFEAAFPLSIHSQPGSRRVSGEVNGGQHRLKIVTVNGDVELAQLNGAL
jgi:Putative adhesin